MVDIEALGTRPAGSVILSIGACRFDETGIGERFYRPIDVFDSLMHGLTVDADTIDFWRRQPAESKGALKPGLPLENVLVAFTDFLANELMLPQQYLWAKGPDFDLVLLTAAYQALGRKQPWSYRNARDVRTILALAPLSRLAGEMPTSGAHHALHDAELQAKQVIAAAKALGVELSKMP